MVCEMTGRAADATVRAQTHVREQASAQTGLVYIRNFMRLQRRKAKRRRRLSNGFCRGGVRRLQEQHANQREGRQVSRCFNRLIALLREGAEREMQRNDD
jgi:hypothetical protein